VGNVKNNGPELIEPVDPADPARIPAQEMLDL
jgi:hypothetical protein